MYSIILCGGSGTRLWPLSRKNFPKQFLSLYSDKSLLQETYLRMRAIMPAENIVLVTSQEKSIYYNVLSQIKEVEKNLAVENVLPEPAGLNTAPAITYAVKFLLEKKKIDPDAPMIVLPSDSFVGDREKFLEVIKSAFANVGGRIGTIGITPRGPETGFGYIRKGESFGAGFLADEFKEKPDRPTAEKYLASGHYVWNSGMFIFSGRTFAQELKKHSPEIYGALIKDYDEFLGDFAKMPSISIDYTLAEKSTNVAVFEGEFGWSDIGSFDALVEIIGDKAGRQVGIDSKNIFVHSESDRLVATIGVDDLIVVENNDSILIQKKGRSEDVKRLVGLLKEKNCKEVDHNLVGYRPWGKYEVLIDEPDHKVKKLTVYPGSQLSLQSHLHRAEHWVVVKGTAEVVNGEETIILRENESTFIPATAKHRLKNPGLINLEVIEVQTGKYLEEDDIARFKDVYDRV